ncbi:MAG: tripartite tricarboxylate transporter permease [Candidatus Pacearchaeota archaeon]
MLIELFIALLIGIIAGTFTGLFPGIHINLVAAFLIACFPLLSSFLPLIALAVFVISMSITHTFIDFIPSIFLGAPEEDSFLSVLPGHRMLLEGKAYEAFVITLYGSLTALAIVLIFTPLFILFLSSVFNFFKSAIPFVLIFISFYLIYREKNYTLSLIVFLLAGILGYLSFNLPVKDPLLPLLSGLFGLSGLIISLKTKAHLPRQEIPKLKHVKLSRKEFLKSVSAILLSAPFCSFLPGIGSGHAATIGSEIIPQNTKGFLFLVGATNTIVMGLSFITLYAINKTRSGSAAAIGEILKAISLQDLAILIAAMIISGILAFVVGVKLSKFAAINIAKFSYRKITLATLFIILAVNILFTNPLGLLILVTATSLGIFAIASESRRINLMGALIMPSIIYYII